jgi:trehalose 2-sulfotransferase
MTDTFLSGPEFDLPIYKGKPKKSYIICSTGRCGSTLLCSLLTNTRVMGVPHEYLNVSRHGQFLIKRLLPDHVGEVPMETYFDALVSRRTTSNGVFGLKAHFNQSLPQYTNGFIPWYFGPIKHVVIRRRDILGQAISLVIAAQTGKWTSHEKATAEPVYSHEDIAKSIEVTKYYNKLWDDLFVLNKIEPWTLYYEDLLERPQQEIQGVVDFVGVRADVDVNLEDAGLKREATPLNAEWRKRFQIETKASA